MCIVQKRIKFENLVIFSGIIQSIMLIFTISTRYEILIQLCEFFEVIIYLYIIRRFIRLLLQFKQKEVNSKIYNM